MRKHFQKWHPGQPVMLIMQPLFYDVHTKEGNNLLKATHEGASKALDKDANVVQVNWTNYYSARRRLMGEKFNSVNCYISNYTTLV